MIVHDPLIMDNGVRNDGNRIVGFCEAVTRFR
jgi:hypothetical protein